MKKIPGQGNPIVAFRVPERDFRDLARAATKEGLHISEYARRHLRLAIRKTLGGRPAAKAS